MTESSGHAATGLRVRETRHLVAYARALHVAGWASYEVCDLVRDAAKRLGLVVDHARAEAITRTAVRA